MYWGFTIVIFKLGVSLVTRHFVALKPPASSLSVQKPPFVLRPHLAGRDIRFARPV
jgi:hypothetical protein